jgi:hypothetical protein
MDIEIVCKDAEESEEPCGKIFSYNSKDGFNVEWNEDYEYIENDDFENEEDDEGDDE